MMTSMHPNQTMILKSLTQHRKPEHIIYRLRLIILRMGAVLPTLVNINWLSQPVVLAVGNPLSQSLGAIRHHNKLMYISHQVVSHLMMAITAKRPRPLIKQKLISLCWPFNNMKMWPMLNSTVSPIPIKRTFSWLKPHRTVGWGIGVLVGAALRWPAQHTRWTDGAFLPTMAPVGHRWA